MIITQNHLFGPNKFGGTHLGAVGRYGPGLGTRTTGATHLWSGGQKLILERPRNSIAQNMINGLIYIYTIMYV